MNNEEIEKDIKLMLVRREQLHNQIKDVNAVLIYLSEKQQQILEQNKTKENKIPDEVGLNRLYNEETGKKAIWRGNPTKGYIKWKEEKVRETIQNKNRLR